MYRSGSIRSSCAAPEQRARLSRVTSRMFSAARSPDRSAMKSFEPSLPGTPSISLKAIVVDASAIAEVLLRTSLSVFFVTQITAPDADLHVPELCDLEFVSVLRGG